MKEEASELQEQRYVKILLKHLGKPRKIKRLFYVNKKKKKE